jgi:uncharacterized hydantoinase/oxoprolinase family protein
MLTRLAHLLTTEVVGLTETGEAVDLIEDGREGIRLLLVHACLRHKIHVDKSAKRRIN